MENYYRLLGVARGASTRTVKAAFRTLLKQSHPDINPLDQSAAERTRCIVEAYQTLSNTRKRDAYDRQLLAARHSAYLAVSSGGWEAESRSRARAFALATIFIILIASATFYVRTVYAYRGPEFRPCPNAINFETPDLRLPAVVEPDLAEPMAWFRTREFQMSMADPLTASALTECCWRASLASMARKDRQAVVFYRQMLQQSLATGVRLGD